MYGFNSRPHISVLMSLIALVAGIQRLKYKHINRYRLDTYTINP